MAMSVLTKEKRDEKQKIYVGVEVFQGIVEDVHIFRTPVEAEKWFRSLTGESYDLFYSEGLNELSDYDQTKIFEIEIPEWLKITSN